MEERKKHQKTKMVLAFITFGIFIFIGISMCSKNSLPDYKIRSEKVNASGVKTIIEIVLPQKEPKEKLEEISKQYREKYKSENILIFFYLTDTQKHNYAYTGWHGDKFDGVEIFQPIYGDLSWFADSLKMQDAEITGMWGDTLEAPYIIGMVKQRDNTIIKTAFLESKYVSQEIMKIRNDNGVNIYSNKNEPDKHESFIVTADNNIHMYNGFYDINGERVGGELQVTLPPLK